MDVSRKVITNPINNIPVNVKSHVHGWTQVWRHQLDASINHKCTPAVLIADTVYIDHGANFGGTLNLFGGATEEVFRKLNLIAQCKNVVSLDWDMPDFGAMLKKRIGAKTTYPGITEAWCDALSSRFSTVQSLKQEDLNLPSITLGDSHSISFSDFGQRVLRNDGKTLFGSLKGGLLEMFRGATPTETVHLSFGSIDIRHHILRHDNFDLDDTISRYVDQGKEIEDKFGVKVKFAYPVPVEYEERRIPKTGYFKKTPFYGSWQERNDLTLRFIELLETKSSGSTVAPPAHWYTMDPEKYAKTYMEHGSSVHIAPPYYHRNSWGETFIGAQ